MGSGKPKVLQTPFQQQQTQQQQQTNTYGTASIGNTPEAKALLDVPIDVGTKFEVDPGVGRRTDLAEQESMNRWNSAFAGNIPRLLRMQNQESESRAIRSQGAAEAQQAEYQRNLQENQARTMRTQMELERRRLLLPQIVQTGGTNTGNTYSSGYNSQVTQPQGGFLTGLGQGIGSAI
jgi:hypothetical protein